MYYRKDLYAFIQIYKYIHKNDIESSYLLRCLQIYL